MAVSRDEVEAIAALARLRLTPDEVTRFTEQLSKILEHVERFRALDLASVDPSPQAIDASPYLPPLRTDDPAPTLAREEALYNAPRAEDGLFAVPRILKERG